MSAGAGVNPGLAPDDLVATRYEVADGVALVTLNRPERLNGWTGRMEREYRLCLEAADHDPDVRVAVVTGAGRAFCAGADKAGLDRMAAAGEYDDGQRGRPLPQVGSPARPDFEQRHTFPPAQRRSDAAGSKRRRTRPAGRGGKLTTSFARLGLPAEYGASWILPRLIGAGRAADLLLSSRVVLADEAADWGLVNRVFEPDSLLPATMSYAREIAAGCSPAALAVIKQQLYADLLDDLATSARRSYELMELMATQPDFAEGVTALSERRAPRFGGLPKH